MKLWPVLLLGVFLLICATSSGEDELEGLEDGEESPLGSLLLRSRRNINPKCPKKEFPGKSACDDPNNCPPVCEAAGKCVMRGPPGKPKKRFGCPDPPGMCCCEEFQCWCCGGC